MAQRGEKCLPSAKQRDANVSYRTTVSTTVSTANVSDQWFNRRTIVTSGQTGFHSITPGSLSVLSVGKNGPALVLDHHGASSEIESEDASAMHQHL